MVAGARNVYVYDCLSGNFIGGDWSVHRDLTPGLPEDWKEFNRAFTPEYIEHNPGRSQVAAGLAGGMLWTIVKGMRIGDIVLMPDSQNVFHFGQISSDYYYAPEGPLQHRRAVEWLPTTVHRHSFSEEMQRSLRSWGTVADMTKYSTELHGILVGASAPTLAVLNDPDVEDPTAFALEKHLEDFLVANWASTALAKTHTIFHEDGQQVGQQYDTDTGPIDILAMSLDGNEILAIELKRGRASDSVVGQIQRYMGYVQEVIAEPHQSVLRVLDVELDALLAAVEPDEVACLTVHGAVVLAGKVADDGRSILMTRAPRSANWHVAKGAATACLSATTGRPASRRCTASRAATSSAFGITGPRDVPVPRPGPVRGRRATGCPRR